MVQVADVKLKPCPFCKGEVELWKYSEAIKCRFICKKCKVEVEFPRGLDSKDCIKKWNRRDTQKGITVDGGRCCINAKSFLGLVAAREFDELWCESDKDIYTAIRHFEAE